MLIGPRFSVSNFGSKDPRTINLGVHSLVLKSGRLLLSCSFGALHRLSRVDSALNYDGMI